MSNSNDTIQPCDMTHVRSYSYFGVKNVIIHVYSNNHNSQSYNAIEKWLNPNKCRNQQPYKLNRKGNIQYYKANHIHINKSQRNLPALVRLKTYLSK